MHTGLCFSVRVGVQIPPSLRNMYKELMQDIDGFVPPDHGYLAGWAKQGVLLLNACLTVREREPNSHEGKGWERLTDAVIHWINDHCSGVVFLLWGAYAQKKGAFINQKRHCVLKTVHPSPLSASRGFFGCKHFSKANEYLEKNGGKEIDWKYLPTDLQL
jgi:uracil-DNA glycosylase